MISTQQTVSALNMAHPANTQEVEDYMQQLSLTPHMDVNGMQQQNGSSAEEGRRKVIGRQLQSPGSFQWQQSAGINYPQTSMSPQQFLQMQQQQTMHHLQPMQPHYYPQPTEYPPPGFLHPADQQAHYGYTNYNPSSLPPAQSQKMKPPSKQKTAAAQMMFRKKAETYPPKQQQSRAFNRSLSVGSEPATHAYNLFQPQDISSYHPQETPRSSSHPPTTAVELVEADGNPDPLLSPDDGIDLCDQGLGLVGKSIPPPERRITKPLSTLDEESGSDTDFSDTHPNKFPIAIEEHANRNCAYRRQPVRSGPQVKVIKKSGEVYSLSSPTETPEVDQELMRRYYRKDLVRVCVCGRYDTKEPLLENRGRDNDADGYEVHYNIKCKWKSYEDFRTKKRVIIRLCKCYKPSF